MVEVGLAIKMDMSSWLKLVLRVQNRTISGFVELFKDERLLDVLNGASTRRPKSREKALELIDSVIIGPDSKEDERPTLYVNKPSIWFAATLEKDGGRGNLNKIGWREYPFVEKLAVPVHIELAPFSLSGNMHLAQGQMASHLLDETVSFLPITDVKVQPLVNRLWANVTFAAVNREQILSLQQDDIPLLNVDHGGGSIPNN